jgi:hypothetical protein
LVASVAATAHAQSIDDGIMLGKGTVFAGDVFTYDHWDDYWEGPLERDNGNIGTITTRTNLWFGNYAVSDRLNLLVSTPYVWTRASRGVLRGMQGVQDLSLAAKLQLFERPVAGGALRAIAVAGGGIPLTDYTPDYQPLSIGFGSRRLSGRGTLHYQTTPGWFGTFSAAYTWRGDVRLDRPFYFTDGEMHFTDVVDMPNVADYVARGGYMRGQLMATLFFSQQYTLGGGDIRRQDMPFVSNRMNASRVGAGAMLPLPRLPVAAQLSYSYVVRGRNVGQSTTLSAGLVVTVPSGERTR